MFRHWPSSSRRPPRGFAGDRRGATAVEFALIAWPLVVLLFGSIEVGRVLWTQTALDRTATAAARCIGIRSGSCSSNGAYNHDLAVSFVQKEARSWGLPVDASRIGVTDASDCDGAPGHSKVDIAVTVLSPVPFIAVLMSGSQDMRATACFPTQASP